MEKAHCLVLPYPLQGHINPMLHFAKRLLQKDITVTLVLTRQLAKTTKLSSSTSISIETISDGFDEGMPPDVSLAAYVSRFRQVGPETLKGLVQRLADMGRPVSCIIYDLFLSWGLDVAKELGLLAAAFLTQSCAVDQIYYLVHRGELKVPLPKGDEVLLPGLPPLKPEDMPSFVYIYGSYPPYFELVVDQFAGLGGKVDWIFLNTFHKLEEEVIDYMAKFLPVKTIGPTVPSMYLDKRLPDDRAYGLNIYKPDTGVCMKWLNEQQPESVIYVSFGSMAQLGQEQMEELAWGLRLSNRHFLWVVRSSEESKLPNDFAKETSEKGLIVSWCPQLDVLAHEAICCFVTHCGWNSTLEALSLGIPMVGVPQWTDQSTNSKFMTDVWKIGVRARADDKGLVSRETIARCISEVTEGERREEMKKNAIKWKELAREAMSEGGSSDTSIQEFVSSLIATSKSK